MLNHVDMVLADSSNIASIQNYKHNKFLVSIINLQTILQFDKLNLEINYSELNFCNKFSSRYLKKLQKSFKNLKNFASQLNEWKIFAKGLRR